MKKSVWPVATTRLGHCPARASGSGAAVIGVGREVEVDAVAVEAGVQRAALGVEGERCRAVDRAPLAQDVGRGQRGVAAEVDLGGRREPAQAEGVGVVALRRPGTRRTPSRRCRARRRSTACGLASSGCLAAGRQRPGCRRRPVAEGVDPGDEACHGAHDAKRGNASWSTSSCLQKAQRTRVRPASRPASGGRS